MDKETKNRILDIIKDFEKYLGAGIAEIWSIFIIRYRALGFGYILMILMGIAGCFLIRPYIDKTLFIIFFSVVFIFSLLMIPIITQFIIAAKYSALEKVFEKINWLLNKKEQ